MAEELHGGYFTLETGNTLYPEMPNEPIDHDKYIPETFRILGKSVPRRDGFAKTSGRAIFTKDILLPGMLYAKFLKSPYANAKIKSMDTSAAEAMPGVVAILRYDDPELEGRSAIGPYGYYFGGGVPCPRDHAQYFGHQVGAVVAAETDDIAVEALKAIKVEWEERTPMVTFEDAIASGTPARPEDPSTPHEGNMVVEFLSTHGDVEEGLAEADKIITFKTNRMKYGDTTAEPYCFAAKWTGDSIEAWVKSQWPQEHRAMLSYGFGVPLDKIKINAPFQGGTFGGWHVMPEGGVGAFCVTELARRTGLPVLWADDRIDDFKFCDQADCRESHQVGFKTDGTITAVEIESLGESGGLGSSGSINAIKENTNIHNWSLLSRMVATNTFQPTAIREGSSWMYTTTVVLSRVAAELGMDPTEHALLLDGVDGEGTEVLDEYKAERGFPDRDSLKECIEAGKAAIGWDEKWHEPGAKMLPNGRMHGLGFNWCHEWEDTRGAGTAGVMILQDGSAQIMGLRCDNGVNAETTYCQIVAEELGMKFEDVTYRGQDDTLFAPMTPDGSCNLCSNGYLMRKAAKLAKQRLLEAATTDVTPKNYYWAAPFSGMKPEDLDIQDSFVFPKADPSNKVSVVDIVRDDHGFGFQPTVMSSSPQTNLKPKIFASMFHRQGTYGGGNILRLCRQAHFCEIEVDPETGEIVINKTVNVNDVGKVLNWGGVTGQQYGGSYFGAGISVNEEHILDPSTGVLLNGNLYEYKWANIQSIDVCEAIPIETSLGHGPYGTNGLGENIGATMRFVIYGAIYNALGVWVDEFPTTPDRVLKALGKA